MSRKLRMLADAKIENSAHQEAVAAQLIAQARVSVQEKTSASFKAYWLLEGTLYSKKWITRNGGKEQLVGNCWRHTIDIDFSSPMPNGFNLIDVVNRPLLGLLQKWAFDLRSGLLGRDLGANAWVRAVSWAKTCINWLILNEPSCPQKYGLSLLNENSISNLLSQLSKGGWLEALDVNNRIINYLATKAPDINIIYVPGNPTIINPDLVSNVKEFYYNSPVKEQLSLDGNSLSKKYISEQLGINYQILRSDSTTLLLSQFDRHQRQEDFSKTRSKRTDGARPSAKEGAYATNFKYLKAFLEGKITQPSLFPSIELENLESIYSKHISNTQISTHVTTIPLSVGLSYIRMAIKWVTIYGDELAKAACAYTQYKANSQSTNMGYKKRVKLDFSMTASLLSSGLVNEHPTGDLMALSDIFNVNLNTTRPKHAEAHSNPSFLTIINALIGACIMCIGFLKPSRIDELSELPRNCLIEKGFTHKNYWLSLPLGKSGQKELNQNVDKPIPFITAKAISLLQRIGGCLAKSYNLKTEPSSRLLFMPSGVGFRPPHGSDFEEKINRCLDAFIDLNDLPLDTSGNKFYVRIHEMRRFFIIMMFYHGKFHSLDAIRDIAGHTDAGHTYAYITENGDYSEIVKIELSLIDDKLLQHEIAHSRDCHNGLARLYNDLCANFSVQRIESIPQRDYFEFLKGLHATGILTLQVFKIDATESDGTTHSIDVAVRYKE